VLVFQFVMYVLSMQFHTQTPKEELESGNETGFESTLVHRMFVVRSSRLVMTERAERC